MVKVNRIVRFSPQRVARRLFAVLAAAVAAVAIFGDRSPQSSLSPATHAPVLQMPVFYELPLLDVVTADNRKFGLEIFIEPQTPADLELIRRRETEVKQKAIRSVRRFNARELTRHQRQPALKETLLEEIRSAAAPAKIKNIYFNRRRP